MCQTVGISCAASPTFHLILCPLLGWCDLVEPSCPAPLLPHWIVKRALPLARHTLVIGAETWLQELVHPEDRE